MNSAEDVHKTGRVLWLMCNTGAVKLVPYLQQMRDRMTQPRPGDLVIEVTQWLRTFDPDRVGILIRRETDRWVIEPYERPGEEQGWQNAEFVALPARGEGWTGGSQ